jgi:aspartate racemase
MARLHRARNTQIQLGGAELAHSVLSTEHAHMKVIGLIGGMSWESTTEYYRLINESIKEKLGGLHSAKCVLYSVDFAEVAELQRRGQWPDAAQLLVDAAQNVEKAGADFVLICTNTMHKLADTIQARVGTPLLHIADATAEKVKRAGIQRVGLLGTRITMEEDFYRGRLADRHGLEVAIPNPDDRETVNRIIYEELCLGVIRPESKARIAGIISRLAQMGVEGIILGCTELGLLLEAGDSSVPLFDTTRAHALAAVEAALKP